MSIVKSLLKAFNQKPIVVYPVYIKLAGDYPTAAALAQVIYWHDIKGGEFYKTDEDFESELCLTLDQFKRVKNRLKTLTFLTIKAKQVPPKTFYAVDYDALGIAINEAMENPNLCKNPQIEKCKNPQNDFGEKAHLVQGENPQNDLREKAQNITENTYRDYSENVCSSKAGQFVGNPPIESPELIPVLNDFEIKCYQWARTHDHWSKWIFSTETFLKYFNSPKGTLRGQYENHLMMEAKNANNSGNNANSVNRNAKPSAADRQAASAQRVLERAQAERNQ